MVYNKTTYRETGKTPGGILSATNKTAIIGAGFAGLGVAEALKRMGIEYDQFDRNAEPGGLWFQGVYPGTHLITSKNTTAYHDFPMPDWYPDYPSCDQLKKYLQNFSSYHGLCKHLQCDTEIIKIESVQNGLEWKLYFKSGEVRNYADVVIATGNHWSPWLPKIASDFSGIQFHSSEYKGDNNFVNKRVLVVGGGNSAADIAVIASNRARHVHISMRAGHWFLPKTLFGKPIGEILKPWFPVWLIRLFLFVAVGSYRHYGLASPQHDLFIEDPTVNDGLLNRLKHGKIKAYPGIKCVYGNTIEFVDGRCEQYDVVCWATGFKVSLPIVAKEIVPVKNNIPELVAGMYAPYHRNLYIFGVGRLIKPIPRYGVGPMISAGANILALSILAQRKMKKPLVYWLSKFLSKPKRYSAGPSFSLWVTKVIGWVGMKILCRPVFSGENLKSEKFIENKKN